MQFDAVVVGGGFAGLTAANHIAMEGYRPIVLEAGIDEKYMCNSRVSTGALHVGFRNPEDPADQLFENIMSETDGTARKDIAQTLAENSQATINWMRDEGCEFMQHPRRASGMPMMVPGREMKAGLDWENSGPNKFLLALADKLEERGGQLRRGARVSGLVHNDGQVCGVYTEAGEKIEAIAVVIADGGFQADPDLVGRHITLSPEKLRQRNTQTGRGDGLKMAVAIGAETIGLDKFYGHVLSRDAMMNEKLWPYPQLDVVCAKSIVVTPDGRRFADEGQGGVYFTNAIAALDDPLSATAVFDHTVWEDAKVADIVPPNPSLEQNGGTVFEAASLAELAGLAGLDPVGLLDTVTEYNDSIRAGGVGGLSPTRNTEKFPAHLIENAPYYAIPLCAGITVTSGGLAVDGSAQVLSKSGEVISGLYAAGSVVGGLEGGPRVGYVGGLIKAFGIGRIAGRAIAAKLANKCIKMP